MNISEELQGTAGISPKLSALVLEAENALSETFREREDIALLTQEKVLYAMQKNRLSAPHFAWNTGYGYDDAGREVTERIFADVFHTEAALVRTQIVNGTHALHLTLTGILRPGDEVIYATGKPYDTLEYTIGLAGGGRGSLAEFGVSYRQVELTEEGELDIEGVLAAVSAKTKMVCLQRSTGYAWRRALTIEQIENFCARLKERYPEIIVMVDNCYGEFLDTKEPTDVGVDIMAASLIKNPGGGLALSGGYVAGRRDLVEMVAARLYTPGIGGECGLTFGQTRNILQGLFMAPQTVCQTAKGATLLGEVMSRLGYDVCPTPSDRRSDIIQAVALGSEEKMLAFCKGIQSAAAVDAYVEPVAADMPGYPDPVIMASGSFVQGATIELSSDGPVRPPYIVYFQGGLTYAHAKLGIMKALQRMENDGVL